MLEQAVTKLNVSCEPCSKAVQEIASKFSEQQLSTPFSLISPEGSTQASDKVRIGNLVAGFSNYPKKPVDNHPFPQAFEDWFKERGLTWERNLSVRIEEDLHKELHEPGKNWKGWNEEWKDFISKENPKKPYTKGQIEEFARKLMEKWKIDKLPMHSYYSKKFRPMFQRGFAKLKLLLGLCGFVLTAYDAYLFYRAVDEGRWAEAFSSGTGLASGLAFLVASLGLSPAFAVAGVGYSLFFH